MRSQYPCARPVSAARLGIELLRRLITVARDEQLGSLHAYMLQENVEMRALVQKHGFRISITEDPAVLFAVLDL